MPTKAESDASYWKERRAQLRAPGPTRLVHPSVLPCENPAEHAALVAEYYARFIPTRPEERGYVDDIIYCEWILRRLERTGVELNTYVHQNCGRTHEDYPVGQPAAEKPKVFNALEWRAISTRKALREAFAGLRDLRAHPIPDSPRPPALPPPVTETTPTTSPRIGFVLGTCTPAPEPPSGTVPPEAPEAPPAASRLDNKG